MYLIYILRHDLRLADNPIFHALSSRSANFTHLIPVYVLTPHQIEVSGLSQSNISPYPEARSRVGKFWRCGPHRVKFLSEAIYDLKDTLRGLGSDLLVRVGPLDTVVDGLLKSEALKGKCGAVWMSRDWATEEIIEEGKVRRVVQNAKVDWKTWDAEDTLIHNDDLQMKPSDLPDVFTSFRKSVEPLRDNIRKPLAPFSGTLPPLPDDLPPQEAPFEIPSSLPELTQALLRPLGIPPALSPQTAHPFIGGESRARTRLLHLLSSGAMTKYKDTRNEMIGEDFSSKLSGYLALGCITARQINHMMVEFEEVCWNTGENKGTAAMRFELLWRDYMKLCARKYGSALFSVHGFRGKQDHGKHTEIEWKAAADEPRKVERFLAGTTGIGLVDASMRELAATGYTSNRARQNCASFLATWLGVDWRLGAEWYESMLVDYDVASNWGNWQYVAGVGNDPRGDGEGRARRFNPIKQAWDYDKKGEYVRMWVDEVKEIDDLDVVFQCSRGLQGKKKYAGALKDVEMARDPLVRIQYDRRRK